MKAIRIHSYGPPEVLSYDEVPDPVAGPTEVLVAVEASGVNPADYKFRSGMLARAFTKPLPFTLGMDIAGQIVGVGQDVKDFSVGNRVLAMLYMMGNGGYAERVAVPVEWCAPWPAALTAPLAAALPTPATTAVEMLEDDLALKAGQSILVIGATGAVGTDRVLRGAATRRASSGRGASAIPLRGPLCRRCPGAGR
jgi:NADPH2:quinone reductase